MSHQELQFAYRLRPLSRLLEGGELERQEIYFAKPDQLNDPMEGFRDIFWIGDAVVWENLLIHFLMSLEWAYSLLAIGGEHEPIKWEYIPLLKLQEASPSPLHAARVEALIGLFLSNQHIKSLIQTIAKRRSPIRRNELAAYLRDIQPFAIDTIYRNYVQHKLASDRPIDPQVQDHIGRSLAQAVALVEHTLELENQSEQPELLVDVVFDSREQIDSELAFIHHYNNPTLTAVGREFVFVTFCEQYVRQIETLLYPDWYTSCFSKGCSDSSLWGSYGVNHTAVCLKFRVHQTNGKPFIRLYGQKGFSSSGLFSGYTDHELYNVEYGLKHVPIDFFRSIGRFTAMTLKKRWYTSRSGKLSNCGDEIFTNENAWRERYWANFQHAIVSKLQAWHYEQEQRLVISSDFIDFSTQEHRLLRYDFQDLDGIIFGMRTPKDDKVRICQIIEEKCRSSSRNDFHFYEARYSRMTGTIEPVELRFLKFEHESTS